MSRALGVIPARYESTRFRGKPLAPLGNSTLVQHVWTHAAEADRLERVVVATDDERIREACLAFGAEVMMTSPDHPSGTDRVAEVAAKIDGAFDIVVNIQGDEPLLQPTTLDRLVAAFDETPRPRMATLAEVVRDPRDVGDPNVVKVVTDDAGRALYFSRAAIPHVRPGGTPEDSPAAPYRKHVGIYAYLTATLLELTRLPASVLERCEGLEQLRALQAGFDIRVVDCDDDTIGVDTPADLERAEARLRELHAPTEGSER